MSHTLPIVCRRGTDGKRGKERVRRMDGISQIVKRDGRVVEFDSAKIARAILRAAQSVGGSNRQEAQRLGQQVVFKLLRAGRKIPSVEEVQDTVEQVLIEEGHAKTAKAYILYRHEHDALRKEKQLVLEKEDIDEVDKRFDVNALRVLKSRYLRKSPDGKLIETPKQLFTRVATHAALPDMFYHENVFDYQAKQIVREKEDFDPSTADGMYSIGQYALNQHHMDGVKRIYDRFNGQGRMKVGWTQFLQMLAKGEFGSYEANIREFFNLMVEKHFMPNTPAIANFGNALGMGSACFVLDVEDSIEGIMETLKNTAIVFKAGGGMGYNFSKLRPEGSFVSTTGGSASGPISFMRLFDTMTEVIKQGGIRRGANMGILNSNHPDIERFITAKHGNKALRNFNISVLIMPDFWGHYEANTPYPLVDPKSKEVVKHVNPRELFDKIVYQAWESAEPGVIFYDRVNDTNPFYKHLGPIVTTNPCGEVLLYPNEPCNLGSINVWAFAKYDAEGKVFFDWEHLKETVMSTTRFLDNVIEVNKFPLKQIEEMSLATRKVGLGVMGVGDLLYELRLPFNTDEGRAFMEKLMQFISYWSKVESVRLARERGNLPFYDKSFYPEGRMPFTGFDHPEAWEMDWKGLSEDVRKHGIRNGYTTIIAPTGSISMIAGCSSGMEPVYSLVFQKNVKVGSFFYVDPAFERAMKREGLYSDRLMEKISNNGGRIQGIEEVPEHLQRVFVTAMDTTPEDHIRALASFQKWVDSSISKTNNFPANATVEDMRESYLLAYGLGCKDVTVFRDGSIKDQVLVAPKRKEEEKTITSIKPEHVPAVETHLGGSALMMERNEPQKAKSPKQWTDCPECKTKLEKKEGCVLCPSCGWGLCS